MSGAARVESVDAIKDFRVYIAKFQDMANRALGDADSDVNRISRWLEGEANTYWNNAIRKRQEVLAKAEDALRYKRLYKDASGSTQSAVEEMKAVKIAKDKLEHAQQKLAAVKKWTKELQRQVTLYRGGVAAFTNQVNAGMKGAHSHLGAMLEHLDEYFGITAESREEAEAAAAAAGGAVEASGASMSRAAEERPEPPPGIDPAAIRATIPSPEAIASAHPAPREAVRLACDAVNSSQIAEIAKFSENTAPADAETIVTTPTILRETTLFMVRLENTRYIGPIEQPDSESYNTITVGDLRAGRPDFAELLALPVGYIAVIGPGGLKAVFDATNKIVLLNV